MLGDEVPVRAQLLSPVPLMAADDSSRQACLKEALRMHPGVAFPLERVVPAACTSIPVCGRAYYLPPGTVVGINPAVVHRDRSVFGPDADVFRPERWFVDTSDAGDEARVRKMERTILAVRLHMDTTRDAMQ